MHNLQLFQYSDRSVPPEVGADRISLIKKRLTGAGGFALFLEMTKTSRDLANLGTVSAKLLGGVI